MMSGDDEEMRRVDDDLNQICVIVQQTILT